MSENKEQTQNILIVGDSHTNELMESFKFPRVDYTIIERSKEIRRGFLSHYRFDKYIVFNEPDRKVGMLKSWGSAWTFDPSAIDNLSIFNNPESHCLFWLGFNDILDMDKHEDLDGTVHKYLSTIVNTFDKTNIHILYPLATTHMLKDPNYARFCNALDKACLIFGLDKPKDMSSGKESILQNPEEYQDAHHLNRNHYASMFNNMIKLITEGSGGNVNDSPIIT